VDYTGEMTRDEIKNMLKARAQRRQTNYEDYEKYIQNPTAEARAILFPEEKNKQGPTPSLKSSTSASTTSTDSLSSRESEDFIVSNSNVKQQIQ
jgi:hypothetical protein